MLLAVKKSDGEVIKMDTIRGPFKKYVTGLGGRGSRKIVTNGDKWGRGSSQTVMSPLINFHEKCS